MASIINGSSPTVTFSDGTTQATAGLTSTTGLTSANPTIASGVLTFPDATAQNSASGVAKAWVNFVGSTGARFSSYNVSSVTRDSTGSYTINFTTALANANYALLGTVSLQSNALGSAYAFILTGSNSPTTTSVGIQTGYTTGGVIAGNDYNAISVAIFN